MACLVAGCGSASRARSGHNSRENGLYDGARDESTSTPHCTEMEDPSHECRDHIQGHQRADHAHDRRPELGGARADGTFVIVSLQLTNNKDETKTFTDSSAKVETSAGKKYETSDKAVLAFGDSGLLLKDIQPDVTTRGKLAFELPPSKVSGSTLVVEDLFGSGEIRVDLGL